MTSFTGLKLITQNAYEKTCRSLTISVGCTLQLCTYIHVHTHTSLWYITDSIGLQCLHTASERVTTALTYIHTYAEFKIRIGKYMEKWPNSLTVFGHLQNFLAICNVLCITIMLIKRAEYFWKCSNISNFGQKWPMTDLFLTLHTT